MTIKNKRILRQIAKEWAKGILLSTELIDETDLTEEEEDFLMQEIAIIANRITKEDSLGSLHAIINKYFEFE